MKQIASLLLMCDGRDLGLSINAGDKEPAGPDLTLNADFPV
jgi:hypothetical protein